MIETMEFWEKNAPLSLLFMDNGFFGNLLTPKKVDFNRPGGPTNNNKKGMHDFKQDMIS